MPITNTMMSISTIFSGAGEAMPPLLVGRLIDEKPMILIQVCGILAIVLTLFMCSEFRSSAIFPVFGSFDNHSEVEKFRE